MSHTKADFRFLGSNFVRILTWGKRVLNPQPSNFSLSKILRNTPEVLSDPIFLRRLCRVSNNTARLVNSVYEMSSVCFFYPSRPRSCSLLPPLPPSASSPLLPPPPLSCCRLQQSLTVITAAELQILLCGIFCPLFLFISFFFFAHKVEAVGCSFQTRGRTLTKVKILKPVKQ